MLKHLPLLLLLPLNSIFLKKAGHTGPPGIVVVETLGRWDMGGMFDLNNSALPLAVSGTVILNLWVTILWKVE